MPCRPRLVCFAAALAFVSVFVPPLAARDERTADSAPAAPVSALFYRLGHNIPRAFVCDYGAWYAAGAASTWLMVETGADWGWRNVAYRHQTIAALSISAEISGYVVPALFPVAAYIAGRTRADGALQLAALASLQAAGVAELYHVLLKLATGRKAPGITDGLTNQKEDEARDFSGDFSFFTGRRGFIDGWPSGHTAAVVAMSVAFSRVYRDAPAAPYIKGALYAFSGLMALGMSFNSHWASDVIAGALMGVAAGKAVGASFAAPPPAGAPSARVAFRPYVLPAHIGVRITL